MEGAFGAGACGGDAVEGLIFGEQRVDGFGGGETSRRLREVG